MSPRTISPFGPYLATDRLRAMALGQELPAEQDGAALFADICGFTAHGERLVAELGELEGAERLAAELSRIYGVILPLVHDHGGSVVGFNGDAVTCWFRSDDGRRAVRAAHAMQARISGQDGLSIKVALAAGRARRFAVGSPDVQRLDVVAGSVMDRMAAAERQAQEGEIVVSREIVGLPGEGVIVREHRGGAAFAVLEPALERAPASVRPEPFGERAPWELDGIAARPWLLPAVHERLTSGHGDFLAEFRRVTAMFVGFGGLDYDDDPFVPGKLDAFTRGVQAILARKGGHLLKLTTGDKGSYLVGIFGAPVARDDGVRQAVSSAVELLGLESSFEFIREIRIGVSHGRMLTGAFGTRERRAYDVLGTEANIAARLMQFARPGEALVTPRVREACPDFEFLDKGLVKLKGRALPLATAAVIGRSRGRQGALSVRGPSSRAGSPGAGSIVGRDTERERIGARLASFAESGRGGALVIEGEPGIGKTRLAEDLRDQAATLGFTVLVGAGDSIEQHTPYRALRAPFGSLLFGASTEALEPAVAIARAGSLLGGTAEMELLPLLSAVVPLGLPENERTRRMVGSARAESTSHLLGRLLGSFARTERVVLLLEDSHWLDSASWAVVLHLRRTIPSVLVVVVTRPPPRADTDGRWEALAQFARGAERLHLAPLTEAHAATLACSRLGVGSLPASVARLIAETAGGHPLFSQELAVALRERGVLAIDGDRCRLVGDAGALEVADLFDNVEEAITSRIDGLGPGEQLALKVASVIGREFSADSVQSVHPVAADRARIPEFLEAAARLGITQTRWVAGHATHSFRHAITHEVIYGLLPSAPRRDLHRAVGLLLEERSEADPARAYPLLAHHFSRADIPAKAVGYLEKAGEQAHRVHANREVVRFLTEALVQDERARLATPLTRARWQRQIGGALLDLGRFAESRRELQKSAARLALSTSSTRSGLALNLTTGALQQVLHRNLPGRFLGRGAADTEARLEAARVQLGLTKLHFYLNEGPHLIDAALRAMNVAEKAGVSPELALAYSANAVVAGVVPLRGLAETYGRLAIETASKAGDRAAEARVLVTVAVYDVGIGRWGLARERVRRARELFDLLGDRRQWEETLAVEAPAALHVGPPGEARDLLERLHVSARLREDPHTLSWGLLGQVEVRLREPGTVHLPAALANVEEVESLFDRNLGPMEEIRAHALGALVRFRLKDEAGAEASADRALHLVTLHRPASPHTLEGHASVAAVYLGLWRQDSGGRGAHDAAERRWGERARASSVALSRYAKIFPIARPRALLVEGLRHRLAGNPRRAILAFRTALSAAVALGMPHEAALVRAELETAGG